MNLRFLSRIRLSYIGNHAQGVAYSARHLKIAATIVMPLGTPSIKHLNVAQMGANVVLAGEDFDSAKEEASRLENLQGLINIPAFDDPYVIAGQGTIGKEIAAQTDFFENVEAVFCCVGGGGLIAGIGVYVKRFAPHVKIVGVETYDANAMLQSLKKKERVLMKEVGLFADGTAVRLVGAENFRLCSEVIDEMIEVTTDETCAAIDDVFKDTRAILEPSGALALAGLKKYVAQNPSPNTPNNNRSLVALASGANINLDRLRFISERAVIGEKKEALLLVNLPERPGSFRHLVRAVLPQAVTEFSYRYANEEGANVMMSITVNPATRTSEMTNLMHRLCQNGIAATDLSDDELAKTHIRYLVGGRSNAQNERLYMFEFPERPGALMKFLMTVRPDQNISLFHYRNQGGDVGKVLAGIQCEDSQKQELEGFLSKLGYPYVDCTDSSAYHTVLRD